jgi:thymidylate synthase
MKAYIKLLKKILKKGVEKESGRANMPNTWGIEYGKITMNMKNGFPLLTTKKMFWRGIVHELLWFLRGETNIRYLVDNKVNIWNGDAYRWYLKWWDESGHKWEELKKYETEEEFIEAVKSDDAASQYPYPWGDRDDYMIGDLGKVYGHQWRDQNGVDQVQEVIDGLKNNPYSRYHIIDGWNKADFKDMALPPCHLLYHFIVKPLSAEKRWELFQDFDWNEPLEMKNDSDEEIHRICDKHGVPKFHLNLIMYQRSCDTFLGVPFNIASMSLLLMIIADVSNMIPGKATWVGGDIHLYMDHLPVVKEQIDRAPRYLPEMIIKKELKTLEDITALSIDDFRLLNYMPHDKLKGELFTGNKKK